MEVNGVTLGVAAVVGLAIGAFATGQVGGVVLPLLFVLACPLMMMFIRASMAGGRDRYGSAPRGDALDPHELAPHEDVVPAPGPRERR